MRTYLNPQAMKESCQEKGFPLQATGLGGKGGWVPADVSTQQCTLTHAEEQGKLAQERLCKDLQ